jgi:hypothetical protein
MGTRRNTTRVIDSLIWAANWISSALASDNDIEAQLDDPAGNDNADAEPAEVWTIAGVQSRPKDGSETIGYAKALRIQLGDTHLVIGTHDPRHVETCQPGELVLHALGDDGSRRAKVVIKPDGTIDVSGTQVVIGNPDGTLEKVALGDALQTYADALKTWLEAHTHNVVNVQPGASTIATAIPLNIPSTSPGTLKSTKHSVET